MIADVDSVTTVDKASVTYNSPLTYLDMSWIKYSNPSMESGVAAYFETKKTPERVAKQMGR